MNKPQDFITVGYPRSGNTFLNYAFKSMYYSEAINNNFHTQLTIKKYSHVFVPLRNPLDCISSWNNYSFSPSLESDIKYYLRFHKEVLVNLEKITLIDFDKFTTSLEYIKYRVKDSLGLEPVANPTDSEIKLKMLGDGKTVNLPVNNGAELQAVREQLVEIASFQECLELYDRLKSVTHTE
jgi:hypothetical protein